MNGFRAELFDKIVGLNGHAVVQGYDGRLSDWQRIADAAKKTPGVTSALPLIHVQGNATSAPKIVAKMVKTNANAVLNAEIIEGATESGPLS